MSWLANVLRRKPETAPALPDREALDARLRAAFECAATGNLAEAERQYRALLEDDPRNADALYLLAVIAVASDRALEAVDLCQKGIAIRPGDPALWFYLAMSFYLLGLRADSVQAWRTAVALDPGDAIARTNFGAALVDQGMYDEGRRELEHVLETGHETAEVRFNLGVAWRDHGNVEEAIAACRRAIEMKPEYMEAYTNLLLTMNYSDKCAAAELFREHRIFGARFAKPYAEPALDRTWPRRLRVGYVSPDFRNHVVMTFFAPILENHDRTRFEVFCYHTYRSADHVTQRMRDLAEHWRDCDHLSHDQLAQQMREDRIDLLVDLAGHTGDNSLPALMQKPAPLQATYLGYPNTTGIAAIDYRITDARADPPGEADRLSAERLLRPWPTYFSYEPLRGDVPEPGPLPVRANGYITFGCFNNIPKMSDAFLDAAARVLDRVPGSRLILKSRTLGVPHVAERIGARFRRAGIDAGRVDLLGWLPTTGGHLGAYRSVDIALDSFPYNGATTTCEALWMGVPVVTFRGERHAGRMGSSLLSVVGLGDLVATDVDGYVQTAAALASDMPRLEALRAGMRGRMEASPLTDGKGFTRALEQAYLDAWQEKRRPQEIRALSEGELASLLQKMREQRAAGNRIEAEESCKQVLNARPDDMEALTALWDLSYETRNHGVAVEWLRRGIAANDRVALLHYMMGYSLMEQGNVRDAGEYFRKAVALDPGMARAHNNLGCILEAMGDLDGAIRSYERAVELSPELADAVYNLGNAHRQYWRIDRAIEHIARASQLQPGRGDWKCNLGDLLGVQLKLDEAVACYDAALAIDGEDARALAGRAWILQQLGRVEESDACYLKAMALKPDEPRIHSAWLLSQHYRCGNESLLEEHRAWAKRHTRGIGRQAARAPGERRPARRLNIGYVSADLRRHSAAGFIEPLLAAHDRSRFKVFCYSNAVVADEVTQRLRPLCEEWRDIARWRDEWVADRVRADRIDLLVDLAGHTGEGRLLLFARKLAPVQVTWLGYPNTTGLAAVDYRLTDAIADPPGIADDCHAEQLVRLEQGFLCYSAPLESPPVSDCPFMSAGHVTFGCFNTLPKLTPEMIALWAGILREFPQARLKLKSFGLRAQSARLRIEQQFSAHGIDPARLELSGPEDSFSGHLSQYGAVDLALDVFPYNGTATTCEALWMGVPVVTLAGGMHVSRVGASILGSAGLDDLVAHSPEEYARKALGLARDGARLRKLRGSMRERLQSSPLMDGQGFARSVEKAYAEMWEQWIRKEEATYPLLPLPAEPSKEGE